MWASVSSVAETEMEKGKASWKNTVKIQGAEACQVAWPTVGTPRPSSGLRPCTGPTFRHRVGTVEGLLLRPSCAIGGGAQRSDRSRALREVCPSGLHPSLTGSNGSDMFGQVARKEPGARELRGGQALVPAPQAVGRENTPQGLG